MTVFVDTSGLYAVLDAGDAHHSRAARAWRDLLDDGHPLVTHDFVLVETTALLQRRAPLRVVAALHQAILPAMEIMSVDAALRYAAVTALLAARRSGVSLVDWTSFTLMRRHGIETAFAFDDDFADGGFRLIP